MPDEITVTVDSAAEQVSAVVNGGAPKVAASVLEATMESALWGTPAATEAELDVLLAVPNARIVLRGIFPNGGRVIPQGTTVMFPPGTGFDGSDGLYLQFAQAPANDPPYQIFFNQEAAGGKVYGLWSGAYGVRPEWWGAAGDGAEASPTDNYGPLQNAIMSTDRSSDTGDGLGPVVVLLTGRYYDTTQGLSTKVGGKYYPATLQGRQKNGTFIRAKSGDFTPATSSAGNPVLLAWGGGASWFRAIEALQIKDLTVDCNNEACGGIANTESWGEGGMIANVRVTRFIGHAVSIQGLSTLGIVMDNLEVNGWNHAHAQADDENDRAIYFSGYGLSVRGFSHNRGDSSRLPVGIELRGKHAKLENLHIENCIDGVLCVGTGVYAVSGVDFREGTNAVRISGTAAVVNVLGIWRDRDNTSYCLVDDGRGLSASGEGAGANDNMVGFYARARSSDYWNVTNSDELDDASKTNQSTMT